MNARRRHALARRDEARAEIGKVRAEHARRRDVAPGRHHAGEQDRLGKELADFRDQRERAEQAGMSARARAHRDQAIDAGFRRLARVAHVDHVVEYQPAIALHGADQLLHGAERRDDQRHLVLDRDFEIGLQARIALVHDQVHAERRRCAAGVALDAVEALADFDEPGLIGLAGPVVERREGADDAGAAGFHHEVRVGDEEHRRGDRRDRQAAMKLDGDRQVAGPSFYSAATRSRAFNFGITRSANSSTERRASSNVISPNAKRHAM